ncbi:hypothetical protein NDU88_005698 [Pleurodeles waltl]|uniref:Uncharacterized protein n=1 Tax=Pleurodeles waltl TaxID=8319 RepID=A0AAV7UMV2_PLEWA|nr:hypothetical protein NDU88_005698 [Pleurodeles waltl]
MPPVLPGRRALGPPNARCSPRGRPFSRARGLGLQGKAAIPRRGERRPSIVEEKGRAVAQHHRRYGPPQSTPMIDATEALQVPRGKRRPVPLSVAAGSTPQPQEAGSTPRTATATAAMGGSRQHQASPHLLIARPAPS